MAREGGRRPCAQAVTAWRMCSEWPCAPWLSDVRCVRPVAPGAFRPAFQRVRPSKKGLLGVPGVPERRLLCSPEASSIRVVCGWPRECLPESCPSLVPLRARCALRLSEPVRRTRRWPIPPSRLPPPAGEVRPEQPGRRGPRSQASPVFGGPIAPRRARRRRPEWVVEMPYTFPGKEWGGRC